MNRTEHTSTVISGAWTEALRAFASTARSQLLIASPWVKRPIIQVLLASLQPIPRPEIYLLARLELEDFLAGSSDLNVFCPSHGQIGVNLHARALANLHAKFLISDDHGLILGSANLTEGGLYRNQEALIMSREPDLISAARSLFWEWWESAATVGPSYFSWVQEELLSLTPPEGEEAAGRKRTRAHKARRVAIRPPVSIPWIAPRGAGSAAQQLAAFRPVGIANASRTSPQIKPKPEDSEQALDWLERQSKWVPSSERAAPNFVELLDSYIHHPDPNVRATAVDRVGRLRVLALQSTLRGFLGDVAELPSVRAASAFALTLIGDPACFDDLAQACDEQGYIGRWARRGCFMLLSRIDREQRQWFLHSQSIRPSAELDALILQVRADTGTNSERLAKALVLEMLVRAKWDEACLDLVAFAVFKLGERVSVSRKKQGGYGGFLKKTASLLRVTPGDLKHGFLSISFVRSVWDSGWPSGLVELFGDRWAALRNDADAFASRLASGADLDSLSSALSV
jgi:hypothetical protein